MKSSIIMKPWKTTISLSALLFFMFALTVLSLPSIDVSMPSSSSPASPDNGKITYDKGANIITVTGYSSGTPCTFNDVWSADKAGTQELVDARAITGADAGLVAVNHALRPTDYYVLGLADVYITITDFTADSTIQIVGTEEYGVAQTENIAITGNGTYNSNEYWRTIASTQVTVFSGSFTYTLTQGQWGVIWRMGATHYQVNCKIQIGDGSTTTTFGDTGKELVFTYTNRAYGWAFRATTNATVNLGTLSGSSQKEGSNGCTFIWTGTGAVYLPGGGGTINCYACTFVSNDQRMYVAPQGRFYECVLTNNAIFQDNDNGNADDIYRMSITGSTAAPAAWYPNLPGGTYEDIYISGVQGAVNFYAVSSSLTLKNLIVKRITAYTINFVGTSVDQYLVNPTFDSWSFSWAGGSTNKVYRQYEFDLKVTDKDDNAISGATVTLKDKDGNTVFSVSTNAKGDIATQTVSRGYYDEAHGDTLQEYSPHTLTIIKLRYQTYTGTFTLSQKTNWTIALQPLTDGGLIEHVGFVPVDPDLTSPSGTYRWLDVADQAYGIGYRNSCNYSQAAVEVAYCAEGNKLQGLLKARNLKPNFAYQLKLVGTPGTADNERIGLAGRWWQEEWTGTTWANGQNLNDKGDGSSPNPNDQTYLSRRYIQDSSSSTGYHYRYTGYLVFDYFITDSNGTATLQFETGRCYHVMWKTTQRSNATNDGPVKTATFDPTPSQPAYDTDYASNTVSIFGEWERLPMGQVNLQTGEYNCQIVLTEESFHGSGGTLAGNWAGAVTANIMFTIN